LSQSTRLTGEHSDRIFIARPSLHSVLKYSPTLFLTTTLTLLAQSHLHRFMGGCTT